METATDQPREATDDPGWQFVGFHDLRRTWATQLRSADVDPDELEAIIRGNDDSE
mgnify:CR=1 FL=1